MNGEWNKTNLVRVKIDGKDIVSALRIWFVCPTVFAAHRQKFKRLALELT